MSRDGTILTGLTAYSSEELRNVLQVLVTFRNCHHDEPYVHERLVPKKKIVRLGNRIKSNRWPTQIAMDRNVVVQNGRISVSTLNGSSIISISPSGRIARLSYLSPLSCNLDDTRYVRITRLMYLDDGEL